MIDKKSRGSERSFKERKPKVPEYIYSGQHPKERDRREEKGKVMSF